MPYLVTCEPGTSVGVLKAVGTMADDEGIVRAYDHEAQICQRGDILEDDEVSPVVQAMFEKTADLNNPSVAHAHTYLRKITTAQAKKLMAQPAGGLADDLSVADQVPEDDPLSEQVVSRPKGQFGTEE